MRRDELYLNDIVEAADHIATFLAQMDFESFRQSELVRSAVVHKLAIIGEAAARISEEVKRRSSQIPCPQIVAFRNILVHAYFGIDWDEVWKAAQVDCPALSREVSGILRTEFREAGGIAFHEQVRPASVTQRKPRSSKAPQDVSGPVAVAILSVRQKAARCRVLGSGVEVTVRATRRCDVAPGEIAVVRPSKPWDYAGHPYLSGEIESTRLDVESLGLVPLKLEPRGVWDPAEEYWGDEGEPIEKWAKPIIARGRRPAFEMEQVLPGMDPEDPDPDSDPIGQAVDLQEAGDREGAHKILMDLCQADLRCLDAHAHLGNMVFDRHPDNAIRHYEVGLRIGELSLGKDFDGVLPWGWIDNRPFLRCMHGFGICLWRLKRFKDAGKIFERMLWLNPSDNQGARFLMSDVRRKVSWELSGNK
jgi:uncharacterized protein with HEPN domain